jgi:hypothetical protein
MLLCCLLAALLMSSCISALAPMATALDDPGIVTLNGLLLAPRMFAHKARVLRSSNGSAVLHLI